MLAPSPLIEDEEASKASLKSMPSLGNCMQVSTHNQDTPAANKQHKIEDRLPEYFNHGRILAPLAGIIPDLSFNLVGHHGLQPFQREAPL